MAEPLWLHIEEVESVLCHAKQLWLGLDFDGTLTPIVATPDGAVLDADAGTTLAALCGQDCIDVAIISGRALSDIRSKVALDGITYAGNHGMEISGAGIEFEDSEAHALRPRMDEIETGLRRRLTAISGTFVEHKGLSLSVHYRLAGPIDAGLAAACVHASVANDPDFRVRAGAKVLEILPVKSGDKGSAIRTLLKMRASRNALPIYIGDDLTDEDAFRAIPNGITIRVGANRATSARYYVASQPEVHKFLNWLLNLVSKR